MAISALTVWEVRASGASDTAGGGFVAGSGGTDRSQQNGAQVAVGGGVVTSSITTTVVTFTGSTYTVLAGDVGNIVQFISGTNVTAGFYQITSVSAGLNGTWTLDRTPLTSGTTTNAVANMGGALATLSKLASAMQNSGKAYCTGAFSSTATNTFAQTVATPTAAAPPSRLIGYSATRTDGGMATLTLATNTGLTALSITGSGFGIENFAIDCASLGTSTGINMVGNHDYVQNCKVSNFTTKGIGLAGTFQTILECELTGGTAAATGAITTSGGSPALNIYSCYIHDNSCTGISNTTSASVSVVRNLVTNNSGASSDGIQCMNSSIIINNTCHNNGRDGIRNGATTFSGVYMRNNLVTNNGGFGINHSASSFPADLQYDGNAFFSNTSGSRNGLDDVTGIYAVSPYTNTRDVTLSVSPYVGPTTGATANFGLNDTVGGGRSLKAAGRPNAWAGNTGTVAYPDMGAVQHQDLVAPHFIG